MSADRQLTCDVCVIGSGAGGAVLAAGLAEAGVDVVILEEGGEYGARDFAVLDESWSLPTLYQERGGRATEDRAITVLQGRSVGGGTTVNWTTCFRTPDRILAHWRDLHGLVLTSEDLAPHFAAVEQRLNIGPWPVTLVNENNRRLLEGARSLGVETTVLSRNVSGCANSGYCGFGCPYDAKQSMHMTYLPDAIAAGARLFPNTRATRLQTEGDRIVAVHAESMDPGADRPAGPRLTVRPQMTVCSAGAINGPALLQRSGINDRGRVGKRTFLHPVIAVAGRYDAPIHPWFGAPQSVSSHHWVDRGSQVGFFVEAAPLHPVMASVAFAMHGEAKTRLMSQLQNTSALIALQVDGLHPDDHGGTVTARPDGRISLDYPLGPVLQESLQEAHVQLLRLHLAAGAREVLTLHNEPIIVSSEAGIARLRSAKYGALQHTMFSAHQMGGCAMGPDPATSVVDLSMRHHRLRDLFVVDGSVLPTSLGVNPSLTIYGLAHWARDGVLAALNE